MFTYSLSGLEIKGSADTLQEVEENECTARSAVYQVLGQIFAPPGPDQAGKFRDGRWAKELSTGAELLPFEFAIDESAGNGDLSDPEYAAEWERLFGDDSADASPLRSGTHLPGTAVSEVQREYEYFGLATGGGDLPPDHLSTECEFMGFVCFKEASVTSDRLRASYRRAQADFLGRFLASWVPAMVATARSQSPAGPIEWALARLEHFVQADRAYLASLLGT